jgi:hypothetical protein
MYSRNETQLHIHVSISDLYIPTISPPILQNRQTDHGNTEIDHRYMNVGIRNWAAQFPFWGYCFDFRLSVFAVPEKNIE